MDRKLDPEDIKREKRAERLRRSYEALGKEQNGIFESLAEYTHEVQAEVRSLQIARDRLSEELAPDVGPDDDGSPGDRPPVVRFGRPLIMTERWVSIEATAVGIAICGLLGFFFGVRSSRRSRRLSQGGSSQRQQQRVHQD